MQRISASLGHIALVSVCSFLLFGCGGSSYSEPPPPPPLSTDASLSALSLTGATLDPAFASAVTSYTSTVPFGTDSVDVTATTSDSNASFTINGGTNATVVLAVGDNNISVVVTAENGTTTRTYTIVVTRELFLIDTTVGWNGGESIFSFGDGGAAEVYGQTFVVLAEAPTLQTLSFRVQHSPDDTSGEDLFFSIVVMAWNTDRATGPVLYESALQTITTAESTMTEYAVDTGGLILTPGQEYVAFLSANNGFWNANSTLTRVGWQNAEIYANGESWLLDTDNDSSLITSTAWTNPFGPADFVVIFSLQ